MPKRSLLVLTHDTIASIVAWLLAFWLRFNFEVPPAFLHGMLQTLAWVVPIQAVLFWRFGLYRGIWRYASIPDLRRIVLAVGTASLLVALMLLMLRQEHLVPRSVLVLDPILLVLIMGGSRLAYRAWKEHRVNRVARSSARPVIVLGAGDAAVALIKEFRRGHEWRVAALLDDDAGKHGRLIEGVRVLGPLDILGEAALQLQAASAIIAMPSAHHQARRRAMALCNDAGIDVMTVPSFFDLVSGKVTVSAIRKVELDDLLGRDPVVLDNQGLKQLIGGRTLMITGAGGSIGSELARQVASFEPGLLVLFELSEFALYAIEQEFTSRHPGLRIVCVVGDAKNPARVAQVLRQWRPSTILHAAAYKHVPLMEGENAWEAVLNNAGGTHVLARAAVEHGVEKFVLISTDKAVNPTNVMGATKRLAEMICQATQSSASTRFVMVRFGNVLGSTGSVIPKFRSQIAAGGPVTVTHPEVRRFFMSIPEAAQLVLQAGLMGTGGEIFAMDMGEPVRIVDLARDLIRLSGFTDDEIRIVFTGLRPGEKLYEEVLADDESSLPTPHPKLRIAQARTADQAWLDGVLAWMASEDIPPSAEVRAVLQRWVPEYAPAIHPPLTLPGRATAAGEEPRATNA